MTGLLLLLIIGLELSIMIARFSDYQRFGSGQVWSLLISPLINLSVFIVLFLCTLYLSKVEFDEDNLYKGRGKKVKEIPLEKLVFVRDIMPISLSPNFIFIYVLYYKNEDGELKKLRWYRGRMEINYGRTIEKFFEVVRKKNPDFFLKF